MLFVLVRFHPFDTHRRLWGRQNLSLGISSIRLTCGENLRDTLENTIGVGGSSPLWAVPLLGCWSCFT